MGKNLIQQRRGRGTPRYRSSSHRFLGAVHHPHQSARGTVMDIIHCRGHTAPLMEVVYQGISGTQLSFAPEGISVGQEVIVRGEETPEQQEGMATNGSLSGGPLGSGSIVALKDIPEGSFIHNIELFPGDGGKLVRASGTFARVLAKTEDAVRVILPSRREKVFLPACRAALGVVSGGGRTEKPFLKAGPRFHRFHARNRLYPRVCGISMNAVDHPFGGKCSHIKGRPTQSPRSAPAGRKVGKIAPRRTGRKR